MARTICTVLPLLAFAGALAGTARAGERDAVADVTSLLYVPTRGDLVRLDGTSTTSSDDDARDRLKIALELRGAIDSMTPQEILDYIAGRAPAPPIVDAWVWLPPPPRPAAAAEDPAPAPAAPPVVVAEAPALGPASRDGLDAGDWADGHEAYAPIRLVPEVHVDAQRHTVSDRALFDHRGQERRFLEQQATCAALGGASWLTRDAAGATVPPLPPLRDARGHTRSRYAGPRPRTAEEADVIVRQWGEATLTRLREPVQAAVPPAPPPSFWDTLRAAFGGRR